MSETGSKDQLSLLAFKKELKEALQGSKQSKIPLYIAALAALLAIISMADNETDKVAMSAHIEASNKFAYFQAKNIRMTDSRIGAALFKKLDEQKLAEYWEKKAERYNTEKFEIFKEARAQEAIRTKALNQGDYYKVGVTFLQIAIVLASASLVLGGGLLFWISMVLTLVSLVYSINGVGLFFAFPTDFGFITAWLGEFLHLVRYGPAR